MPGGRNIQELTWGELRILRREMHELRQRVDGNEREMREAHQETRTMLESINRQLMEIRATLTTPERLPSGSLVGSVDPQHPFVSDARANTPQASPTRSEVRRGLLPVDEAGPSHLRPWCANCTDYHTVGECRPVHVVCQRCSLMHWTRDCPYLSVAEGERVEEGEILACGCQAWVAVYSHSVLCVTCGRHHICGRRGGSRCIVCRGCRHACQGMESSEPHEFSSDVDPEEVIPDPEDLGGEEIGDFLADSSPRCPRCNRHHSGDQCPSGTQ